MSITAPPAVPAALAGLYRYRTWLSLGPGAEDCADVDELKGTTSCANPAHVHILCRLPNQFQRRTIDERALAAKARKAREFRDPNTDAAQILEDSLDDIARQGDRAKPELVNDLLGAEWWRDYLEAATDVKEREDEHGVKTFEHIDADQQRYQHLLTQTEEERPQAEFEQLEAHLDVYATTLSERLEELVAPKRVALLERDISDLIDETRNARIEARSQAEFAHTAAVWTWFYGALRDADGEQVFPTLEALEAAPAELIDALKATFEDLTRTAAGDKGNS